MSLSGGVIIVRVSSRLKEFRIVVVVFMLFSGNRERYRYYYMLKLRELRRGNPLSSPFNPLHWGNLVYGFEDALV